ncbi:MAG: amidohydrolase family protein [Dehalococcoidia bacterium]|nr:amidohydrolase family protein [Dehalococcoidia bacterium]
MAASADIILHNAVVHGPVRTADAVVVSGGVIAAVGNSAELMRRAGDDTQVIDCGGRVVVPGIVDPHCHLFAAAAARNGVDCRPAAAPDVAAVIAALRTAAAQGTGWLRGYGYDDSPTGLGRHLNRHDLDAVATQVPVRVEHRSGHACVLNSVGLAQVGIGRDTPDPPGGVIVRDAAGDPTGLLLEMGGWLRERAGVRSGTDKTALRRLAQRLLGYGITAATDAGPDNGLERWQSFIAVVGDGTLPLRLTMMVGFGHMDAIRQAGLSYGSAACDGMLTVGHAKIMLTASGGTLQPHPAELAEMVAEAHGLGFPVAVHAVERDAVVAAALALADAPSLELPDGRIAPDRIEHCAECPPDVLELVASSGAAVTVNAGFLHYDGERYRRTVAADLLPHLYPAGALAARGVPVALASDAPVVEPNPWAAMAAAVTRRSAEGESLGGVSVPSVADALGMHTNGERIAAGGPADLAVVEPDPLGAVVEELASVRAVVTVVGGRVVWQRIRG